MNIHPSFTISPASYISKRYISCKKLFIMKPDWWDSVLRPECRVYWIIPSKHRKVQGDDRRFQETKTFL